MNLIDRYLGKTILHTIFLVLFATAGIEFFILMIGELGDIGHNHYTLFSALFYVFLSLPEQIYQLFPMAGLLGMLMAFGLLANHSELVILQSTGMSPLRITAAALKTIIILLIAVSLLGEVVAPKATMYANSFKDKLLQSNKNKSGVAYDLWLHIQNNFIHIHEVDAQNNLSGISWYEFDDQNNLLQTTLANSAQYQNDQWIGYQIKQTLLADKKTLVQQKKSILLPLTMTPRILLDMTENPNDLSLGALHQSLEFHTHSHSESQALQFAFWRRIIQPLAALVMMLLAIPFIFGPLRRASNSLRLVIGIAVGFCFYYANQFFGPVVLLLHWPPLIGAILPTVLFGVIGIFMLYKLRS
ncbi:MAG: putative YjgP/YjgQ family permease [Gammaproteobacteria bacterium]|jgi:lipopolysaccharide export system permease protein|nr:putative YjgP/YjgQ family permease [Gammaproteobacteria bacterium]